MPFKCGKCGKELAGSVKFCRYCGSSSVISKETLAHTLEGFTPSNTQQPLQKRQISPLQNTSPAPPALPTQPYYPANRINPPVFYKNPGVATILSFFWAGAGQIYNGQIGKGIGFIIAYFFSLLLMFLLIGFITTPVLWIVGMIDANNSAKAINQQLAQQDTKYSQPYNTL